MNTPTRLRPAGPDQAVDQLPTLVPGSPPRRQFSLRLDNLSGLYVMGLMLVVFSLWQPDTFFTVTTLKSVADQQSITALLALALIIPMAAGAMDISVSAQMAFALVLVADLQSHGYSPLVSVLAALIAGCVMGAINGFIVVRLNVNPFVATLGSGSVIGGCAYWLTGGQPIVRGFDEGFLSIGRREIFGVPLPVIYLILAAAVLWFVLEHLPVGRYLYATGSNSQASRLAGLRVDRIVFGSLIASGFVSALAGVILCARLGVGSHEVGSPYLLPVFAAAFLGATQIKAGRVNVLGTLVAVYLLAIGVKGLQLAGAPSYVDEIFNGLALVVAVALASRNNKFGFGAS